MYLLKNNIPNKVSCNKVTAEMPICQAENGFSRAEVMKKIKIRVIPFEFCCNLMLADGGEAGDAL